MQRYLRSILSVDVADFTGLMSCKVYYYVGKLSVTLILLSMKLSGNLVMSHWKTGPRMLSITFQVIHPKSNWEVQYLKLLNLKVKCYDKSL